MCGIIGFTGNEPAKDIIIGGLERLEYRGYDSAGLALLSNDQIQVRKRTGKVEELRKLCEAEKMPATCGIGHTRWATHGGVTDVNAHPHRVGKVVLIHNGIIENYRQIVTEYGLADQLVSETDSEVVAALLNKFYEGDPVKAIKKTVKVLSGAFALCIMFQDIPDTIYAISKIGNRPLGFMAWAFGREEMRKSACLLPKDTRSDNQTRYINLLFPLLSSTAKSRI